MEWGTRSSLDEGLRLYEEAKRDNSDVFVQLVERVPDKLIKKEYVEYDEEE